MTKEYLNTVLIRIRKRSKTGEVNILCFVLVLCCGLCVLFNFVVVSLGNRVLEVFFQRYVRLCLYCVLISLLYWCHGLVSDL